MESSSGTTLGSPLSGEMVSATRAGLQPLDRLNRSRFSPLSVVTAAEMKKCSSQNWSLSLTLMKTQQPNHALQRTCPSCFGYTAGVPCAWSLSLGR